MTPERQLAFARAMSLLTSKLLTGQVTPKHAAERLRAAAEWLETPEEGETAAEAERAAQRAPGPTREEIVEVFEHWSQATRRPTSQLTRARGDLIRARLLEGATVEQLQFIASWAPTDMWLNGMENDDGARFDTIETLYKSREYVEKYIERSGWVDGAQPDADSAKIARLEMESLEYFSAGNINKYNELQAEIAAIRSLDGPGECAGKGETTKGLD
jgi:hypothetical protein